MLHSTDPPTIVHAAESTGDEPSVRPLARGTEVGRYVVLEQLGSGAMGVVHAAHDPRLDRRVAIKLVRRVAGSTTIDASLLREAKLMAQLADPNVVAIHDVGVFEGAVYFAMELVDGVDLRTWLMVRRSVPDTLRVFIDAGRGLAAAHAIGLVHRDFKPANVFIATNGRVCVGDFGIATIDRERSSESVTETLDLGHATRTGFVMGTPAYMAPEQALGRPIDARADQFAFCVALWEAIGGARPFDAATSQSRLAMIERAELPAVVPGIDRWLARALAKGLAFDPYQRHADMHALLEILRRGLSPPARRWLAVAVVGGAAVFGIAAMPTQRECSGAAEIANVWNDEQRAAVRSALGASGRPYANDVANDSVRRLDTWVEQWVDARDRTCSTSGADARELDATMQCLTRRRIALAAAVDALANADDEVVVRAREVTAGLPAPRECGEPGSSAVTTPDATEIRSAVEAHRAKLDHALVLLDAGRFRDALERTAFVVDRARELAFAPLLAEALVLHGRAVANATDQNASLPILEEAALVATASGEDATALAAWDRLAVLEATSPDRIQAAIGHIRNGDALVARLGEPSSRATIGHQIAHGRVLEQALDYDGALAVYRDVERRLDDSDLDRHRGAIAAGLARLLQLTGDFAGAEEQGLRAEQIARVQLGDGHPAVAEALTQLGTIHHRRGRFPESRDAFARALAIREAAFPPTHTIVADSITNLALLDMYTGDLSAARTALERVLEIERLRGDLFSIAQIVHNIGAVALQADDLALAEARTREAMALFEQALGTDDPRLCNSYETLASLLLERNAFDEAEALLERSLRLWERAELTDHPGYAGALSELGRAQHRRGNQQAAIATLRRALGIYAPQGIDPIFEVGARHDLVLSLWALGRQAEAHTEAARTRELAATIVGPEGDEIRTRLGAWNDAHREEQ